MYGTIILIQLSIQNGTMANDCIATISKVTDDIVKTLVPDVRSEYIPHAVDGKIFAPK